MSKPKDLETLQQPDKLNSVLTKQKETDFEDCTSCRLMGSAAFIGMGIYTYVSGRSQLLARQREIKRSGSMFGFQSRLVALAGTSLALVGLGTYRLFGTGGIEMV